MSNRYSAGYTLAGDSLTFGPVISTKMACAADSTLTLNGSGGQLARFRAP